MLSPSHTPEDWLWLAPSLQAWVRNARSNWGPVFADSDDRDFRNQPAVVSQAKNSPGMLPRLFLGKELLHWPSRFRSQKLNSVKRHFVVLRLRLPVAPNAFSALSPRVRQSRPSLKCRQISPFVTNHTPSRAEEQAGQKDSFNPILGRFSSELVTFAHAAVGGQEMHSCTVSQCDAVKSHGFRVDYQPTELEKAVQNCSVSNLSDTFILPR
jgi:hypothetical protein